MNESGNDLWINAQHIRSMPLEELRPRVKAELRANKLWREEYDDDESDWFLRAIDVIRQQFFTLKDFSQQGRAYFSDDFDLDEAAVNQNLKSDPTLEGLMAGLADALKAVEPFNAATAEAALRSYAEQKGVKPGLLINASRTMLTGQAVGPSMFEVFEILGQARSVERLLSGIPWSM
jgi:glutamyl-tRNA synthetase